MITQNGVTAVKSVDPVSVCYGPFTEGEKTDPGDESLIADTKALPAGAYEVIVTLGASAAADFGLERRNLANDGTVGSRVVLKAAAAQSGQYRYFFQLLEGERIRVLMDDALTGTAAVAINLRQLP